SACVLPAVPPLRGPPPCILPLRFPRTGGDWQKLPLRVRAPHRGARFMGDFSDCIGWFPGLLITPAPGGDGTDDRLGTGMDMDVLDGDALLTLAAVTVEGFGQSRVGSRELGRLFQVLMPTVESLVPKHRMPVTLHGGVMARDQLCDQHSLDLVARLYANNSGEHRVCLTPPRRRIGGPGARPPYSM